MASDVGHFMESIIIPGFAWLVQDGEFGAGLDTGLLWTISIKPQAYENIAETIISLGDIILVLHLDRIIVLHYYFTLC